MPRLVVGDTGGCCHSGKWQIDAAPGPAVDVRLATVPYGPPEAQVIPYNCLATGFFKREFRGPGVSARPGMRRREQGPVTYYSA